MHIALHAEAALEASNYIVVAHPDRKWPGAMTYSAIAQSLALNVTISLARLYDPGTRRVHPNKRDIASIPLMVRLLKQKRCQKAMMQRARDWTPHLEGMANIHATACGKAIEAAINSYETLQKTPEGRAASKKLREFRNFRLVHSMMRDMIKSLPTYRELFNLIDVARNLVENASLAIDGKNRDLKETEANYRDNADAFWRMALGIKGTN